MNVASLHRFGRQCLRMCCCLVVLAGTALAGSIEIIGQLGQPPSEGMAVSADGSVVVGSINAGDGKQQAFRWTSLGMVLLPRPSGIGMTWASGVSADGNYISGWGGNSFSSAIGWEGFRYNFATPQLDRIAVAGQGIIAKGISADGSLVVGSRAEPEPWQPSNNQIHDTAFRWTPTGGVVSLDCPLYPGKDVHSTASGVSANGQVIVGDVINFTDSIRNAYRWTENDGMSLLNAFTAAAASRDGSVVVGSANGQAYRWEAGVLTPLGLLGGYRSFALGVSGDGAKVVGYIEMSDETKRAFIWDAAHGMELVQDALQARYGFQLPGWTLQKATAISDDGRAIVGRGYYAPDGSEAAWRAVMAPEPSTVSLLVAGGLCGLACIYRRMRTRRLRPRQRTVVVTVIGE